MSRQTIHSGPVGAEVAYRHGRLLAEADARRLRSQLPRSARGGRRPASRRAAIAMAAATGLLVVSGAWATLLGATSTTAPVPAGPTTVHVGGGAGRAVAD